MGTAMEVLWWLAPPAAATVVAMIWAGWLGRRRDDDQRDDSDAALARMAKALDRPTPRRQSGVKPSSAMAEPSHGVAIRGAVRRSSPRRPPQQ